MDLLVDYINYIELHGFVVWVYYGFGFDNRFVLIICSFHVGFVLINHFIYVLHKLSDYIH